MTSSPSKTSPGPPAPLEAARAAARLGLLAEAEATYARLTQDPSMAVEALSFLAAMAFRRQDVGRAVQLLEAAAAADDPSALTSLGAAYEVQGRLDEAVGVFERAGKADPSNFFARLRLGKLLERQGFPRKALPHYFAAIVYANEKGHWTSANPPSPGLLPDVQRAQAAVSTGRRALFHESLALARARGGGESIRRVEEALAIYLGEMRADIPDALQRPQFMFIPGLPSQPWFSREQIPFIEHLEAGFPAIRDEAQEILASGVLPSFFETDDPTFIATKIRSDGRPPSWDAFHFYRHGRRFDENHVRAPKTSAIIEALPLARIRDHSPEICFSLLTPGTVIQPHTGVSNCRAVVHLPLLVPENCAIRVADEVRGWEEGRCLAFDDTFEHEAWNKSDEQIRVVLLMDAWNPNLTEAERMALGDLIVGIGDFNAEVQGNW